MLRVKEHASIPYSSVVFHLGSHFSPSKSWECVIDKKTKKIEKNEKKICFKNKKP